MVDFADTPEQAAFRNEVEQFIDGNLPDALRTQGGMGGLAALFEGGGGDGDEGSPADRMLRIFAVLKPWRDALVGRGWIAPAWPKQYGGADLSPMEQYLLNETFAERSAPLIPVPDVGSTIMVHGTEEQKKEFLPPMVNDDVFWCQGYSEPGSGSDLASLQTRAERDGDDFVINGQKIWTTGAQMAAMMFAMVRTDPEAPKHRGITYLLLRMDAPGISVRPLVQMSDAQGFNEVFFEDVHVPVKNAVGEINRGWYVGATHLDFERSSIGSTVGQLQMLDTLKDGLTEIRDGQPERSRLNRVDCPRLEFADRYIEANIAKTLSQRVISMQARGLVPNHEASMTKLFSTEFSQRIALTATKLLGKYGDVRNGPEEYTPMRGRWASSYLSSVSATIAGGTSEIQRNVIATRGLGLPRG
ncbi:MAG TPA: acyl-CoA dehydrogenase family protein [Dehalococcoidia bacterium]|nr:acyl-CoA dehydrogenase family protein [Dehalococcoidia bacterium]